MHLSKRAGWLLLGLILALPGWSFATIAGSAFEEPLVATAPTSPNEDNALRRAIQAYRGQASPDDFRVFDAFLAEYPRSGWRAALLTNLGLSYYHYGYFSRAIDSWEQAWRAGRSASEPRARALVDRAVGELVRMHARLGHAERLAALLEETSGRHVTGPATEALAGGKEGLWMMQHNPGVAYLCGPMALKNLLLSQGATPAQVEFLDGYRSGPRGVTLAEVARLAGEAKLGYRLVFRDRGQAAPVPSIVHWKVSHFAAIVGETEDRLHIVDPTFGEDLWITRGALDAESSGYFLVPGGELAAGWRHVGHAEAEAVRGMGFVSLFDYLATRWRDLKAWFCGPNKGMCTYNVTEMLVSLTFDDTPVGYQPPRGPAAFTTLTYNQREAGQPANFSFFNVGPKWTLNWLTYIQDDPRAAGANVTRYAAGGGSVAYAGYNAKTLSFTPEPLDASVLVRTNASPITYERRLADGGREVYAQSDGAAIFPRKIFLTQIVDPAGNTLHLTYGSPLHLTSIQDALGRTTTFSYDLAAQPLLVTRITDPFGRGAKLDYDAKGRLIQITDVAGLTSQFTYDASSLINSMTTPYGTAKFAYGETGVYRWLEATDPLGYTERVEFQQQSKGIPYSDPPSLVPKGILAPFNQYLSGRDTFYWDKHAYKLANGDHTLARNRHWTHTSTNINMVNHTVESYKMPFENRIWHNYPGQPNGGIGTAIAGTLDYPSLTGRVLDDGTTQLSQIEYNTLGHVLHTVDPVGRETRYLYDGNQIDLLQILQKTSAAGFSPIATLTYNSQHQPLTVKDAAGQTETFAYNSAGQVTQVTDGLGRITRYEYDPSGYLTRIVNPNGKAAATMTYDPAGRIATRTDSEGYTLSFTYDALDRVTRVTYPDGTTRQYTWNKLDLASVTDRQGRTTQYNYDAVRNLIGVIDPLGQQTQFTYYENGALKSLIDPNGNVTTWNIDLQNRVTGKQYADGNQSTFTYEKTTSRLKSVTDALGQVKQYSYTQDDQLAGVDYLKAVNPTPNVRFTYDPYLRRMASMTDGVGTRTYQYQPPGGPGALLLAQESGPYQNDGIGYQYDALGRLIGRTVGTSAESFSYDNLGRLTAHANDLGVFDLTYLGQAGELVSRHLRGGAMGTDWTYDTNTNDRRLTAIANGGAARGYQYTTTPESQIARIVETATADGAAPAQTWDYTYDPADRLLQGVSSGGLQYTYGYDSADNIMSQQGAAGALGASYNAVNQIASLSTGQGFTYDANGNLTDDGVRTYNWDAENRLIAIVSKADPPRAITFRYDGLGRRIAIVSADGVETRYLWCGAAPCQARDATDAVLRRYFSEGELVAGAGAVLYGQDHLGSVRDVLSAQDGSLIASYDYDAYGNPTQAPGTMGTDFRYAGMFYDQNSGLYLTKFRAYDPVTARWLSRDPLGENGGVNVYSYAAANPVNMTDPLGLVCGCWSEAVGAVRIVSGGVNMFFGAAAFASGSLVEWAVPVLGWVPGFTVQTWGAIRIGYGVYSGVAGLEQVADGFLPCLRNIGQDLRDWWRDRDKREKEWEQERERFRNSKQVVPFFPFPSF